MLIDAMLFSIDSTEENDENRLFEYVARVFQRLIALEKWQLCLTFMDKVSFPTTQTVPTFLKQFVKQTQLSMYHLTLQEADILNSAEEKDEKGTEINAVGDTADDNVESEAAPKLAAAEDSVEIDDFDLFHTQEERQQYQWTAELLYLQAKATVH